MDLPALTQRQDLLNEVLNKLPTTPRIRNIDIVSDHAVRLDVGRKRFRIHKFYPYCFPRGYLVEQVMGGILSCNEAARRIQKKLEA